MRVNLHNIKLFFKNWRSIIKAIYNKKFGKMSVWEEQQRRLTICRTNTCGMYDPKGESPKAVFPGKESCGQCGCYLANKVACMECSCALIELGKEPLW